MFDKFDKSQECARYILDALDRRNIRASWIEEELGLSRGYIQRCSRGKNRMSVDAIYEIGKTLNIDIFDYVT